MRARLMTGGAAMSFSPPRSVHRRGDHLHQALLVDVGRSHIAEAEAVAIGGGADAEAPVDVEVILADATLAWGLQGLAPRLEDHVLDEVSVGQLVHHHGRRALANVHQTRALALGATQG